MAINAPERGIEDMLKEKVTLRKRGQFTVPKNFLDELNMNEGDSFEFRLEDGKIVIVPLLQIPADQSYFWTEAWQAEEREAEEYIRKDHVSGEMDLEDMMNHLDGLMAESE
jgi:AbrB family looped-hinge helix DNA binding protein